MIARCGTEGRRPWSKLRITLDTLKAPVVSDSVVAGTRFMQRGPGDAILEMGCAHPITAVRAPGAKKASS